MATKITIGSLATAIVDLCDIDKINVPQLKNAVNSALGELSQDGDSKVKGKAKIKVGNEENPDEFKLTEKILNKFTGSASSPLRFYYFNQELIALESMVGTISLDEWPSYVAKWMLKFKEVPAEAAA